MYRDVALRDVALRHNYAKLAREAATGLAAMLPMIADNHFSREVALISGAVANRNKESPLAWRAEHTWFGTPEGQKWCNDDAEVT